MSGPHGTRTVRNKATNQKNPLTFISRIETSSGQISCEGLRARSGMVHQAEAQNPACSRGVDMLSVVRDHKALVTVQCLSSYNRGLLLPTHT